MLLLETRELGMDIYLFYTSGLLPSWINSELKVGKKWQLVASVKFLYLFNFFKNIFLIFNFFLFHEKGIYKKGFMEVSSLYQKVEIRLEPAISSLEASVSPKSAVACADEWKMQDHLQEVCNNGVP